MIHFLEGLIAGYGIAIPVGAVAILILSSSMRCGFKVGFMAGAGAASADLAYATLASLAGAILSTLLAPIAGILRIASGLFLIGLGIYGLIKGQVASHQSKKISGECDPWRTYVQFLAITMINPMTVVYFTAFIISRELSATPFSMTTHFLFIFGVGLASLSWQTILVLLGSIAGAQFPKGFRTAAIFIGNLIVLGLGVRILFSALT
jgi:threonine/homoserine/homoserine lactone efflux protein